MAITAVDSVVSHMVFMAELYGLAPHHVLIGEIRCAHQANNEREREPDQKNSGKQTESGNEIRAAVKNLGHVYFAPRREASPGSIQ
jgi:hypothetical protein